MISTSNGIIYIKYKSHVYRDDHFGWQLWMGPSVTIKYRVLRNYIKKQMFKGPKCKTILKIIKKRIYAKQFIGQFPGKESQIEKKNPNVVLQQ